MATQGYQLKITGGSLVNHIVDVGNVLTFRFDADDTPLEQGETYDIEYRAYDFSGNFSDWSPVESIDAPRAVINLATLPAADAYFDLSLETEYFENDPIDLLTNWVAGKSNVNGTGAGRPTFIEAEPTLSDLPAMQFDGIDSLLDGYEGDPPVTVGFTFGFVYSDWVRTQTYESLMFCWNIPLIFIDPGDGTRQLGLYGAGGVAGQFVTFPSKGVVVVQAERATNTMRLWLNGEKIIDGLLGGDITAGSIVGQNTIGGVVAAPDIKLAMLFKTFGILPENKIGFIMEDMNAKYNLY